MDSASRWLPADESCGREPGVKFSDSRFLRQVLQEAERSGSNGAAASIRRLEGMGFGPEVVKVAMHVCGGDERKALQLCMSGLSFLGAGDSNLEHCAPPAPLRCYICGQKYLTEKSLDFHVKACKKRFELREAQRPADERRELLEESDLPEGAASLEQHYEGQKSAFSMPFEHWVETRQPAPDPNKLLPCAFCKRTFLPDRLETHQKVCLQRPKAEPTPTRRRSTCPAPLSPPPPAAMNAYTAFRNQLERCPGCSRQFRPELLASHQKACCPPQSKARLPPSWGRSKSPARSRTSSDARSITPTATARRSSSGNSGGSLSFTPPSRYVPAGSSPKSTPSVRTGVAEAGGSLPSSAGLLERKLLAKASPADESRLRERLEERVPGVEVAGIYQAVNTVQKSVYEALKVSMQKQYADESFPVEKELWHGTSWTFAPKILKQGFNRSFAGRHGTLLGNGTYFSSDPAYSLRFCDKKGGGKDVTKVLIVAQVLVGKYCRGCSSDMEPPIMDCETGDRYDCTVDNVEKPSIFAVFRDFQAFPLYLVEVKAKCV